MLELYSKMLFMHHKKRGKMAIKSLTNLKSAAAAVAVSALLLGGSVTAMTAGDNNRDGRQDFHATLTQLNKSGATGHAYVSLDNDNNADVRVNAKGLIDAPHATHIHYGFEARNECPALSEDINKDGLLETSDGTAAYGPVSTSFTTSGDTSPSSVLAVDRSPTYANGSEYKRNFLFTDEQAQPVRAGHGVVVVHGIDTLEKDGKYSGDQKSELDPTLPAEATAPAVCGVLAAANTDNHSSNNGGGAGNTNGDNQETDVNKADDKADVANGLSIAAIIASIVALGTALAAKARAKRADDRN